MVKIHDFPARCVKRTGLILIDDETHTRHGILQRVNWTDLGIRSVRAVSGAREALALCQDWIPDIVLSDIRMPEMDGVTLCRKLRQLAPECQILFISGYEDVENLRAAIELSAISFIRKPFSIQELEEKLLLAVQKCMMNRKQLRERELLFQNRPAIESETVRALIHGTLDERLWDNLQMLNVKPEEGFQVLLLKARNRIDTVLKNRFSSAMDVCSQAYKHLLYLQDDQRIIAVLCLVAKMHPSNLSAFQAQLEKEVRLISQQGTPVLCAGGSIVLSAEEVRCSYWQALKRLESLFFASYGSIAFSHLHMPEIISNAQPPDAEPFLEAVRELDGATAYRLAEQIYRTLRDENVPVHRIRELYHYMLFTLSQQEQAFFSPAHQETDSLLNLVEHADTLEELYQLLLQKLNVMLEPESGFGDTSRTVWQVLKYIREHLSQTDLSVLQVAQQVYLTPSYLSNIFKKETGMNLNRFIRVFRMEKAKELLCSTNMKVAQVSEKVGFSNVSYFCRSFREYYGSSPESYRKGTGDDEENPKEI